MLDILTSNVEVSWFNALSPLWGLISQTESSSVGLMGGYFKSKVQYASEWIGLWSENFIINFLKMDSYNWLGQVNFMYNWLGTPPSVAGINTEFLGYVI